MRTEEDLRSALRALEEAADSYGTPDFAIPTARVTPLHSPRHTTRRSWVVAASSLAVAAAIVALVIGVVATGGTNPGKVQPGNSTPPPVHSTSVIAPSTPLAAPKTFDLRSLWFSLRPLDGAVVSGVSLSATAQQVRLDTSSGEFWDLTLGAAGAPQPTAANGSEAISIGGRPGFYGYLSGLLYASQANRPVGLVWEYAPGAWATVVSDDQRAISAADATAVADAVEPGVTERVTVPIKVGKAPVGMRLEAYLGGPGGARPTQSGTQGVNAGIDFSAGSATGLTVDFAPRRAGESLTGTKTTISGRTAYLMNGSITLLVGSAYEADVTAGPSGPTITAAQLLDVARSIVFAEDPNDQSTWFDATVALP